MCTQEKAVSCACESERTVHATSKRQLAVLRRDVTKPLRKVKTIGIAFSD